LIAYAGAAAEAPLVGCAEQLIVKALSLFVAELELLFG